MEQHYQVINLHNIIRNQQSKIQQLRQQLRIANEREGIRYGQFVQNNKVVLAQKDKVIEYLKGELNKVQNNVSNGVNDINDKHDKQKDKYQKQIMMQKRKAIELQAKLKRQQNQYEARIQNLKESQLKNVEELKRMNETRSLLSAEIGKLNLYYKSSLFQIGKRKETLLWVDKFTQFLETTTKKEKRTLEDVSNFVKNEINGLKNSLGEMVREFVKNEEDVRTSRQNMSDEIKKIGEEIKKECEKALVQNQQFWNTIKTQKQNVNKEESKALNSSLNKQIESLRGENQDLRSKVKSLEGQKKTIILGFQQLRNLNQSRQSIYRDQIKNLKKTIEDLIEAGTLRDQQFQRQIKYLSGQIQNISSRYYENIEFPLRKTNMKISEDVAQVKVSLSNLQENNNLKLLIENIQKYLDNESDNRASQSLQPFLINENQAINTLAQILQSGDEESSLIKSSGVRLQNQSKTFTSRNNTFEKDYEDLVEQQQIVLKQKYNKSQYEVILAKKHLTKLKQYCENLQKKHNDLMIVNEQLKSNNINTNSNTNTAQKSTVSKNPKSNNTNTKPVQNPNTKNNNNNILIDEISTKRDRNEVDALYKKIAELQAENEALKQSYEAIQGQFRTYSESLKKKMQLKSGSEQIRESIHSQVKSLITKIYKNHQKIENYIQREHILKSELKQNVKQIKQLIFQPIKSLEILAKEVTEIGFGTALKNYSESQHIYSQRNEGESMKSDRNGQSNSDDMKAYKQIINKKAENYHQTNKVVLELIKTLREGSISIKEGKQRYDPKKQKEDDGSLTNRKQTNSTVIKGLQKKIKQCQVQRLKDKQELAERLRLIQGSIQKIGQKINKSNNIKTLLNKFEANLDTKINEIVNKTQIKLDKEEILVLKDEVIGDLKVKLQESNNECEGLRKEMSMLYYEKRS